MKNNPWNMTVYGKPKEKKPIESPYPCSCKRYDTKEGPHPYLMGTCPEIMGISYDEYTSVCSLIKNAVLQGQTGTGGTCVIQAVAINKKLIDTTPIDQLPGIVGHTCIPEYLEHKIIDNTDLYDLPKLLGIFDNSKYLEQKLKAGIA